MMSKIFTKIVKSFTAYLSYIILLSCMVGANLKLFSQVSITTLPQTYTQNFNGLGTSTIAPFNNNASLLGWYVITASGNLVLNTGTTNAANCYNFGVANTNPLTDRALGAISTATTHRFGLRLANNSGSTINSFNISFTGEQWRSFNAGDLVFEYQIATTFTNLTSGTYTAFTPLNFSSLQTSVSPGAALDGNNPANRTTVSATLSAVVPTATEIMFRWSRVGTSSPGLAIDDLSITASNAVITPAITTGGTLAAVPTTYGTASATPSSFSVTGANITAVTGITVAAPAGFEVATVIGGPYSTSINVGGAGNFGPTNVFIRLAATTSAGTYSGNIICTSTGATTRNVAMVSSTVSPRPITITANLVNKNFGTTLTGGAGSTAYTITSGSLAGAQTIGSITIAYGAGAAALDAVATYTGSVTPSAATGGTFTASNYAITYASNNIVVVAVVPTLTTPNLISKTNTSAVIGATISSDGGVALSARGTSFKTTAGVIATDNQLAEGGIATGAYSHSRSPLTPQTQYFYRGYATNAQGTNISPESSFYTLSNPPTAQAANLVANVVSFSQIDLSWDPATFPATGATVRGYVLLRAQGTTPILLAQNGTTPTVITGTIVSSTIVDPTTSFSNPGLTQNLSYTYLLVPFTWDGTNVSTIHYLTTGSLTVTASTPLGPCTPPVTQATGANITAPTASSLTINWTAGSGTNSLVIVRQGSAVSATPVTGTPYTANANFGAGDNLGAGNYVAYNATGNSFTLSNLSASTTYHVAVYTFNLSGYCFNLTGATVANATTSAAPAVIETFEPGTKGSYTPGTDVCALGTWTFTNALIGQSAGSDRFVGTRSARLINTGSINMEFNKANGLGTISIQHAVFGSDGASTWRLDVSDDGGATYTAYQSPIQTTNSTTLNTASFSPNLTGNLIRIRIVKLTGGSNRLNIDQISLGDYVSSNTIATGVIAGSPFCVTNTGGVVVSVPFTSTGIFLSGNVYTAQLSDAAGNFTSPVDIGTFTSTLNSGSITSTIPAGTFTGSAYKIRVIASDPAIIGSASATISSVNLNTPDISGLFAGPNNGSASVVWNNPSGCFDQIVVFASTSTITCVPTGTGSAYIANPVYGTGTNCSGATTVYKNTGNTFSITGLTNGTTYFVKVFVRKGLVWSDGVETTVQPNTVQDGDYQSIASGNWSNAAIWNKRVGGAWVAAPEAPNWFLTSGATIPTTGNVTIISGHTVTVNTGVNASTNKPILNLTVQSGATLIGDGTGTTNTYVTMYGNLICNGTIGVNASTWNSISFNTEGTTVSISGTGNIFASRIRKAFTGNATTNLVIAMNVNLLFGTSSGTTIYNNVNGSTYNVTVNENSTLTCLGSGSLLGNASINGVNGLGGNRAGTFTINGTMNIPGILYATSSNVNAGRLCQWIIGPNGLVNCNQINSDASGVGGHNFTILNGGRLNINTTVGFNTTTPTSFSTTNNTFDLQPGSIVEYSAPSGITHVLTDLTYSNLIVSGSGTKDFIDKNLTSTGLTLTVNKNLTIAGSTVLDATAAPANNINIGGNWLNYGTAGFNESISRVTFNGTSYQSIICPGGENFYNLAISNNSVGGVELNTDVEVANILNLGSDGRLLFGVTPSILRLTNMSPGSNCWLGSGSALLDMSFSASTLYVGCENVGYSGNLNTGTTSLVNYNRDASNPASGGSGNQNIVNGFSYANLSFSSSGTKNVSNNFTVKSNLTIDGGTTSLEILTMIRLLTLGGNITLSGGGTMGGAAGTSCYSWLYIQTTGNNSQIFNGGGNPINCGLLYTDKTANGIVLNAGNTNLNVRNTLRQDNAATLTPNDNRIKIGDTWTIPSAANFITGTSTVEYISSVNQTIVPVNYYNLESSNTGTRTMSTLGTIGIANIFTPFTNTYTFTGSTIDYNGSSNQNIAPFTANPTIVGRTYENLTLSNGSSIKTITAATDIEGALTLNNSVTMALGNNFVNLKSTATKTARVAPVSATANITYGTGKFVVERYYPGRRSWRLITAPVTATGGVGGNTFYNSYQLAGVASASAPIGSGTYITGPTSGVGLDLSPQNNSSLKTYNPTTGNFDAVLNTTTLPISGTGGVATVPDNVGYFMFVRGDRSLANVNAFSPGSVVNETTLRDTGLLQIKSYTFPATPTVGRYTLIGNPYASPVNFGLITKNNVADKCWTWDPNLNVVGGYVLFDALAGYAPVKVPLTSTGTIQQTQIIQSKQAFLVETINATAPSITFNETHKSIVNNLLAFRPSRNKIAPLFAANLYQQLADGSSNLADGALIQFSTEFNNEVDKLDGLKFTNINENIGFANNGPNGTVLMLERRKPVQVGDTLFIKLNRATQRAYKLQFIAKDIAANNLSGYLVDSYTKSSTALNMEGTTSYEFDINSANASFTANRFYVVFKKTVHYQAINAIVAKKDIQVNWEVFEHQQIADYTVEKSSDNEQFSSIGTVTSNNGNNELNAYQFIDVKPIPGIYYYRIKATTTNGATAYSKSVKVVLLNGASDLYVFPNPVQNNHIQLQLNDKVAGNYSVRLFNTLGQVVLKNTVQHTGGTATKAIPFGTEIIAGTYQLEVIEPNNKKVLVQVFIK